MNVNAIYYDGETEKSKKWHERFVEACEKEGLDADMIQDDDIVISETMAKKLDKVLKKRNEATITKGKKIVGRYGNKDVIGKIDSDDTPRAYKCRCGMSYTEDKADYYETKENGIVCHFCGDTLHPTDDRSRPTFQGEVLVYSHMEPKDTFSKGHEYGYSIVKNIHGNWRCSCGLTYTDNLYNFLKFDNQGEYKCRVCGTQMKFHAVPPKPHTIEEVKDAMKSGYFDPNAKPITSDEYQECIDVFLEDLKDITKNCITWGIGNDDKPYTLSCDYSGKHLKKEYLMEDNPKNNKTEV